MAVEQDKAVVRRYYNEVLNERRVDTLEDLAVTDYVEHDPFPGQGDGLADLEARVRLLLNAFNPDQFTIEDMIGEDDRVVVRWMSTGRHTGEFLGIPPTGREFTIAGIDIHRMRDGKMAEHWHVVDQLSHLQQLGIIPRPEASSA